MNNETLFTFWTKECKLNGTEPENPRLSSSLLFLAFHISTKMLEMGTMSLRHTIQRRPIEIVGIFRKLKV